MQASKHESKPARLQAILRERATNAATHRYPPGVLERLNKLHYAFFMEFGIEISKNSIAVLALAYILSDLEEKKDKSEFYSFLVKE